MYIVIGAGPVGLFTAALLSLSGNHVLVFEKRQEYTRTQPIRLWSEFLAKLYLYPILYSKKGKSLCKVFETLSSPFAIRDLELHLKNWILLEASALITFREGEIRNKHELKDIPNIEWIYACDGAHSSWREFYFETHHGKVFEEIMDLEHQECNPSTFKKNKALLLQRSEVKDVIRLSSTRTHILLHKGLELESLDDLDLSIVKSRPITYGCYWANQAVDTKNRIILCGDSLCGVPFTRSLRNGLCCSLVATQWPAMFYENYYSRLRMQEDMVSQVLHTSVQLSRSKDLDLSC